MRSNVTREKLNLFMEELARPAQSNGKVYFTGGATALLLGLREQTIDLDVKFAPEPKGVFEAIEGLKNQLDLNVELAAPDDFIPVTDDWRQKSLFIKSVGPLEFFHFDLRAQALSKVERGHEQDLKDASLFLAHAEITKDEFWAYFQSVKAKLFRYPAIYPAAFEQKVKLFLE